MAESETMAATSKTISSSMMSHFDAPENVTNCHSTPETGTCEDDCGIRTGEAAQNFAVLRRIALSLLKNDKTSKLGVASKRLKAGWNVNYLSKLFGLPG